MTDSTGKLGAPSLGLALAEGPRAATEAMILLGTRGWLARPPAGDPHGVMVLPGFLGSDSYTRPLRRHLRRIGHEVVGWDQGTNLGPVGLAIGELIGVVEQLAESTGGRISLIGHSLGGIYARELARRFPERVRQVITLGTPFGKGRGQATRAGRLYRSINSNRAASPGESGLAEAPPVPTTSVYSRTDGIVNWRVAVQQEGHARCENIEVLGSHCGMALNASVWYLLADRLSLPVSAWHPFRPPAAARFFYPRTDRAGGETSSA